MIAGDGITIEGQTISATGSGATSTIQTYSTDGTFSAVKHDVSNVVTSPYGETLTFTLTTFSFNCFSTTAEYVITGELKEELEKLVPLTYSISNGALSIKNDGTTMKLINSAPDDKVNHYATFTFFDSKPTDGGGGGGENPK